MEGRGMKLVPRIARVAFVGLAVAGLTEPALAAAVVAPGNGGAITQPSNILPSVLPPNVSDSLLPANSSSTFDMLGQKFNVQNGQLEFFSMRPDDGAFKPLLHGGVGNGGLQLQLKW
jgi:hypothetical protein